MRKLQQVFDNVSSEQLLHRQQLNGWIESAIGAAIRRNVRSVTSHRRRRFTQGNPSVTGFMGIGARVCTGSGGSMRTSRWMTHSRAAYVEVLADQTGDVTAGF